MASTVRKDSSNSLRVTGVVVAGREHIRSQHDASLCLAAESCTASFNIIPVKIIPVHMQPVAHTVKARKICGDFGRHDDVVNGKRVCNGGELYVTDLVAFSKKRRGTPIRFAPSAFFGICAGSSVVESIGSRPAIASKSSSASATVFAKGPIWSSEEAIAISPERETLP